MAKSMLREKLFYQNALKLGEIIRTYNAPGTAADLIESL
jgi:hypothetical protein